MEDIKLEQSSGNVFADIGLDHPHHRLAKADLAIKIAETIEHQQLSQTQAAELLGITQPKVSAILNGQLKGFSMEKLMNLLCALDYDVDVVVKPTAHQHGRLQVVCG